MTKHIESIDVLKGITIVLVVIGHAVQGVASSQHLTLNTEYNSIFILKQIIYGFHMPLFFIIAGLFINSWAKRSFKEAISQKIVRLVVPYFIWSAITAIAMQFASNYTNSGLGIKDFLLSPVVPFSQYWFLYVLFFIHIIYYILINIKICNGKLLFLLLSIILYLLNPLVDDIWIFNNLFKYMIFFSLGSYILDFLNLKQFKCNTIILPTIVFLLSNIIYINILYLNNYLLNYYLGFIIAIIGSWFCFLLSYYIVNIKQKIKNICCFFGKKSMEIYCVHLLILAGIRIVFLKIFKIDELWSIVVFSGFITLLLCYIFFYKIYNTTKIFKIIFGER
ncbi:acyltransferase family protein [Megamonas funiformis]|uniref:acyltransferase family protein n=1 Tax=Megamonas funiformis TaxID=437897 RepID=UPI0024309E74|nr:acyltransferase [Megamonas funiformis]